MWFNVGAGESTGATCSLKPNTPGSLAIASYYQGTRCLFPYQLGPVVLPELLEEPEMNYVEVPESATCFFLQGFRDAVVC